MVRIGALAVVAAFLFGPTARAAEDLKLNPRLDYTSDSLDGPLISGNKMDDGISAGVPNYVIIYGEACYNSKRQARRTVSLYDKYKGRIHFVIIDLDSKLSEPQQQLVKKYYTGAIPHVVVIDRNGRSAYNAAGEVDEEKISSILDSEIGR